MVDDFNRSRPTFESLVRDFCHHYDAKVEQSYRMHTRYERPYDYFVDPKRADVMSYREELHRNSVPVFTVSIPADCLEKIVSQDANFRRHGEVDYVWVEMMRRKEALEHRIRSSNPAVKKAYENYSLLLNMVKDEYK